MHVLRRLWRSPAFHAGFGLGILLCAAAAWSAPAAQYQVRVLGPGVGNAIDPSGSIVVGDQFVPQNVASLFFPALRTLGFLSDGNFSSANAVFQGRVCGVSSTGRLGLLTHAFDTLLDDTLEDLGTAGGPDLFSACTGLNATKRVGFADAPDSQRIVPIVFEAGTVAIRPTLGGANGFIDTVNAVGDECGESDTPDVSGLGGDTHATCWFSDDPTTPVDLDGEAGRLSFAHGVNEARRVVGVVTTDEGLRGFIWDPDTGLRVLAPGLGDSQGGANGVNAVGDTVGNSQLADPSGPGFLHEAAIIYDIDDTPIDLSTRVTGLPSDCGFETAVGISDDGRIVVNGHCAGMREVFLLTPSTGVAEAAPEEGLPAEAPPPAMEEPAGDEEVPPVVDEGQPPQMRHRRHHKRQMQMRAWMHSHPHASDHDKRMVNDAMAD
jgi:hypothetical protein